MICLKLTAFIWNQKFYFEIHLNFCINSTSFCKIDISHQKFSNYFMLAAAIFMLSLHKFHMKTIASILSEYQSNFSQTLHSILHFKISSFTSPNHRNSKHTWKTEHDAYEILVFSSFWTSSNYEFQSKLFNRISFF